MFPQLSENAANSVYWLGWAFILLSAILGLVGSFLGLWGDRERERHDDIRMSRNEASTAEAKKQAAIANERAAALNDRAAKSELELAQIRQKQTPRMLTLLNGKFDEILKGKPVGTFRIWYAPENDDALNLSHALAACLLGAGWKGYDPIPIPPLSDRRPDETLLMMASGGMSGGNAIVIRCSKLSDWRSGQSPIGSLTASFERAGLPVGVIDEDFYEWGQTSKDTVGHALLKDEALIVVGPKY